ncbi:hypothetical protein PG994_001989 [Apiospora phragmitis]|uniref:A-kinase anchor protein 7-like phosphoesterase domain-containing protein n=1 Tax=Apiospora phragmitis TaxID=2905665 RepID=A0ABR1WV39_9PEZI
MPPRSPPTHFLCIPLVTSLSRPQLVSALASFSSDVTSPQSFGVPAEAVRPVGTLHLTLGVMSFPKNEGLDRATELLKTLAPRQILGSIIGPQEQAQALGSKDKHEGEDKDKNKDQDPPDPLQPQLSVTLSGLHSMQSPPSRAAVLYSAPVDPDGTLQKFCESIKQTFQQTGIMAEADRPLLLHATILNTIYVKGEKGGGGGGRHGKRRDRVTVDARDILDRYDEFVWMKDVPVEKVAICRMGAKKQEDGDAAYEVEAEIDMDNGQ